MTSETLVTGRADTIETDYEVTAEMLEDAGRAGRRLVRVWRPHRQLAFGLRDTNAEGYDGARQAALAQEFQPVKRSVGGRAVAYTGSTVAFACCQPVTDFRSGFDKRYQNAVVTVQTALGRLGVDAVRGEPARAFCPGDHSLQSDGKLVGVAQRVTLETALVSGIVVVRDHEEIAQVLKTVYDHLDVPFAPETVGSVARAGGVGDPDTVVNGLTAALTTTESPDIVAVEEWTSGTRPVD
jgi:lipoate-protein ligase A